MLVARASIAMLIAVPSPQGERRLPQASAHTSAPPGSSRRVRGGAPAAVSLSPRYPWYARPASLLPLRHLRSPLLGQQGVGGPAQRALAVTESHRYRSVARH